MRQGETRKEEVEKRLNCEKLLLTFYRNEGKTNNNNSKRNNNKGNNNNKH